jgi:hypothetical protein
VSLGLGTITYQLEIWKLWRHSPLFFLIENES